MKLPLICPPGPCKRLGADGPAPTPCPCPFAHQETRPISQIRYSCVKRIHYGKGGSTNNLTRLNLCDGRGVSRQWCLHKRAGFELSRQRVKCNFGIHGMGRAYHLDRHDWNPLLHCGAHWLEVYVPVRILLGITFSHPAMLCSGRYGLRIRLPSFP